MNEKKPTNTNIEQNNAPIIFCEKLVQFQYNNDVVKMVFVAEGNKKGSFLKTVNLVMSFGDFIEYVETINRFINDSNLIDKMIKKTEERKKELLELKKITNK